LFKIPPSGVLVTQGENPFLKWGDGLVVYKDGTEVTCAFRLQNPPKEAVLFRSVGGTNDGREYWAVVGNDEDAKRASLDLGDNESRKKH